MEKEFSAARGAEYEELYVADSKQPSHYNKVTFDLLHRNPIDYKNKRKKTRLVVKNGLENIPLLFENIGLLYTQNKVVYVIDRVSKKYLSDKTLAELETELDGHIFFRANRQYIVNIDFIKSFKSVEKVKLLVDINIPGSNHCIIISQETAPSFRKWMQDA